MSWLISTLRTARFARAVLYFLAAYAGVAAWLPRTRGGGAPPAWASRLGLHHPFSSPAFVAGVVLLFASTLACTWGRRPRILRLLRGELPEAALTLEPRAGLDPVAFLRTQSFGGEGTVLRRFGLALWGGWIFHVGLLVLMAGVAAQQAFHDEASFELAVGEQVRLSEPGAVFGRTSGVFAPSLPPALSVGLLDFDPNLHQRGYAPDRASRLSIGAVGGAAIDAAVDRADGVRADGVTIYQAIPSGLALVVEVSGMGVRSIHLREDGSKAAAATVSAPNGEPVQFRVEAERAISDPAGTGLLAISMTSRGRTTALSPGMVFPFGDRAGALRSVGRWAGFTYARSPGMPGVFAGFAIILLGALLLVFPAAVACVDPTGERAVVRVYGRGGAVLLARWEQRAADGAEPR